MASSLIRFLRRVLDSTGGGGLNQGCTIVLSCDGEQVKLPVPPPSYEVENPYNNTTIQINNIGDINMIGTPGLKTLKFSSFFSGPGLLVYWPAIRRPMDVNQEN